MVLVKKKHEVNMVSAPIFKGLLSVAIPIMLMNVVQSLFSVVDMTMLKVMGQEDAVGAVGASTTLITLITGLLIGVASGSNVVVARYIAKKDQESVSRAVGTSIIFSIVGGIVLLIIGVTFATPFLKMMNCPIELFSEAVLYFRLYFCGVPLLMVYNFIASILRSVGDTRRPMYFLTLGGVFKIIANYLLLRFTNFSVQGVAFATIISWGTAASLCFIVLLKNKGIIKFNIKYFRFYKKEFLEILHIGVPAGLQSATYSIANVIIATTVNSFGKAATTGISIANTFDGILYHISYAPSLAVMPFISQNVSVNQPKRVKEVVIKASLITMALGASFGSLSAIFSGNLSSLMTTDPAVIAYSKQKMMLISSTYFICGIQDVFGATLRGMGKPVIPMITSLVYMCGIRFVWVYAIFPLCPNLTFLYLIWPIGWVLSIITMFISYYIFYNRMKRTFLK